MKKLRFPIMTLAAFGVIWQQNKAEQNIYILCICVVVFMYGMMQLSGKTPSKNIQKDDEKD
ncbi:hypothetical protein B0A58_03115 [Flavobacterium branchiophilum NBRC 15030 = ATCC 35035]|uniref:Uncharacterized protein n=2 Tax=Flavobacterium branchiophilum TaxID=55197 RepID=A0A2H3KBS6_9FLAO|nr:hypothetical protein [Flavobacterium branchiophilum]OXA79756.1 hypothetical protein B0A58_03115 [Flavobacterium branchiophilum NBRC 15030 = ATCC 35035]PDS24595.1 hypothetical protein B0A77_07375 [Flavobacterium branchiophilum]TQM41310.1 hypothetical protein BC670_2261 [Flavobacterium branchiophilum]GEM56087.1 hypothetical protein FB1_23080 [Flavobacterium branchiophilum NBRC 15030 = ATCC 35035]